jgi:hypothetical protein
MINRQRTRKQLAISILTGVVVVSILAVMVGTLSNGQLLIGTLVMALIGLVGIWFFDAGRGWSWLSDLADYFTIVGMIGFWGEFVDTVLSWAIAVIFYWGLATLVRRARSARRGS